ncbi:MAG: hypothetical protein ACREDK_05645 [Thermoplasmata archaeon]
MLRAEHPEVLTAEWIPPVPLGRRVELENLLRLLTPSSERGVTGAIVLGPPGSGTSTLARLAARRCVDAARRGEGGPPPVVASVRARWCRGPQGLAAAFLQRLDPGFRAPGFPVAEILAGFLRRIRRERRPAIVVLDDIGPGAPDLAGILRALVHPDAFLPEGETGLPSLTVILAGRPDAPGAWERVAASGFPLDRRVVLPPYERRELEEIVRDRAARALGRPAPDEWSTRLADHALREGRGATRAIDLLRRELTGVSSAAPGSIWGPRGAPPRLGVEMRVLSAVERASRSGYADLAEVRHWEAELARLEGTRPLPATTLWRRMLRLEAAGLVRRNVRPGGCGGTRSTLEILAPLTEHRPEGPGPTGTRPIDAAPYVRGALGSPG